MLELAVPGRGRVAYEHLLLDFNGTLALDGVLLPGVAERLKNLSGQMTVHVVTADTFGSASETLSCLPLRVKILGRGVQGEAKAAMVENLGASKTVAVGNGSNDAAMLKAAGLGIVILGPEGCATETLSAADIVVPGAEAALDLLLHPRRLVATWRR